MNKLGRIYEGDIIRIATLETLKEEEVERKEKLKAKQDAAYQEDLITAFLPISYTVVVHLKVLTILQSQVKVYLTPNVELFQLMHALIWL